MHMDPAPGIFTVVEPTHIAQRRIFYRAFVQ